MLVEKRIAQRLSGFVSDYNSATRFHLILQPQGWIKLEVICHYPSLDPTLTSLNRVLIWCE